MEALGAFDRAVELLELLPFGETPRFRHNLAAAWMNRADAFRQIDTSMGQSRALRAYGRAIEVARDLPLDEKPSYRVLLASCWINLGNLHQRLSRFSEAVLDYDRGLAALGTLPDSGHRLARHHAATAWTNRGEALMCAPIGNASAAVESARMALRHVEGRAVAGDADVKLGLLALRVIARGLESELRAEASPQSTDRVAALTDVAERGIDLAFAGRERDPQMFDPLIVWFFSFGSRIYGRYQPQFLAEYLEEVIHGLNSGADRGIGDQLRTVARQAADGTLEGLGRNRLIVWGTRQAEILLKTVRELRSAVVLFGP
jgi:tetratricopeptide (TPR) repeat protein